MIRYEQGVYEGCGDYTTVDIEAETPEHFAAQVVEYEAQSSRFKYDPERVFVQSPPAPEVLTQIDGLLADARQAHALAKAKAAGEKKLREAHSAWQREVSKMQSELDRWRDELTAEAIASRERDLKKLRGKEPAK